MIFESTTKTTFTIDANGCTKILRTESSVSPIASQPVVASFVVTPSQMQYNYVTLGKNSAIQLPKNMAINVKFHGNTISARTHKTQMNRLDRMKAPLSYHQSGDIITVTWDSSTNILEFI